MGPDVRLVPSLAPDVPEQDWDAVATGRALFSSHRWVRYGEQQGDSSSAHVLVHDSGRLVGALPTYRFAGPRPHFYDPVNVLAEAGADPSAPLVLGGARVGYTTEILLAPELDPAARGRTSAALVERFRALRERDDDLLTLMYVPDDSLAALLPWLGECDLVVPLNARARLRVPEAGLDGYRELVSRDRWAAVRRELRRFEAAGCRIAVEPLADCHQVLAPLSVQVLERYGHSLTRVDEDRRFRQQAECVAADAWVVLAYRGDTPVAFTQFFDWHGTAYARSHGVDDVLGRAASLYFVTTYYAAVDAAAGRGITTLDLSTATLDVKVARGARLDLLWAVVLDAPWPADRLAAVRATGRERLAYLRGIDPGLPLEVAALVPGQLTGW